MENRLKRLIGQIVTKSSAGGGAGSTLVLEFEDKSYFFVWCSWRIALGSKVLVTSSDTIVPTETNSSPNGYIGKNVPILKNKIVKYIDLKSYYDLFIEFADGYVFQIFCDIGISREDYGINWEFNIPTEKKYFEINNFFEMQVSEE